MNNEVIWTPGMTLETLELRVCGQAYVFYGRNKKMAADSLGIGIRTLDSRLEKIIEQEKQYKESAFDRDRIIAQEMHYARHGRSQPVIELQPQPAPTVGTPSTIPPKAAAPASASNNDAKRVSDSKSAPARTARG